MGRDETRYGTSLDATSLPSTYSLNVEITLSNGPAGTWTIPPKRESTALVLPSIVSRPLLIVPET